RLPTLLLICLCSVTGASSAWLKGFAASGQNPSPADLARQLRGLDGNVFPASEKVKELSQMLARDVRRRTQAANERENQAWLEVRSRTDWEKYRDDRLLALKASLGRFPSPPKELRVRVTRELPGDGYRIDNLVFESRPGLLVTANLYRPARPSAR